MVNKSHNTSINKTLKSRKSVKYLLASIRIHSVDVTTIQGQPRDEPQHIDQPLHGAVDTVVTASHGPDDEGSPRHRRSEYDRGRLSAVYKCMVINIVNAGERYRGEFCASTEHTLAHRCQIVWECDRGEAFATVECAVTDGGQFLREIEGGKAMTA